MSKRGRTLNSQARELVVKLHVYFERESANGGPLIEVTRVQQRVAQALGIGTRTVGKIIKEKYGSSGCEDNLLRSPKRRKKEKHFPDFAIANVQCQYDSPSDTEPERTGVIARPPDDHTYDTRDEPPAFIIRHVNNALQLQSPSHFPEIRPKIMTIGPGSSASVNVIHVGDRPQVLSSSNYPSSQPTEYSINKRIRRSEVVLRQAADCVSRGLTFQTVSEQFNIPISTIRFFMARKGILPQRRRGRSTQPNRTCSSPEPPFHVQHFKLPDMVALKTEDEEPPAQ